MMNAADFVGGGSDASVALPEGCLVEGPRVSVRWSTYLVLAERVRRRVLETARALWWDHGRRLGGDGGGHVCGCGGDAGAAVAGVDLLESVLG